MSAPAPQNLAANLELHEFVRRSRSAPRTARGHREWLHFFLSTGDLELFVNLSVFDDLRPAATTDERGRVLVLARRDGVWLGGVDDIADSELDVPSGRLEARFGGTTVDLVDGVFHLRGGSADGRIRFDLELHARSFPSLATDVRVGHRASFNWLVVPSSFAHGSITVAGARVDVERVPAYHDHNWGTFTHDDFRWQWGHAEDGRTGASIVLTRLLDGVGGTSFLQSLFVWDGPRIARIFRGAEIELTPRGFLGKRGLTVPALASLLASGATEVPARIEVEARSGPDRLSGEIALEDAACVVLGDGARLDTVLLYEALGRVRLSGVIADRTVSVDARVVFETMRSRSAA